MAYPKNTILVVSCPTDCGQVRFPSEDRPGESRGQVMTTHRNPPLVTNAAAVRFTSGKRVKGRMVPVCLLSPM
ncbi:hypothetical protein SKAU_G00419660 [Synaphobranchus kaupii]|uniref:Uncharacterized protein n=1 Tax=Synaphobranchus kaupii TaxID=118154 RepID=A0A9Q1E6K3_SYNKA|nr:hypothetical protein SKAU_G00419660 [Synaphobranchus kaupii]